MTARWLVGFHAVEETLRARPDCVRKVLLEQGKDRELADLLALAKKAGVMIERAPRFKLDRLSKGMRHQGAAIFAELPEAADLKSYLKNLSEEEKKGTILVALDQIQDPHNLGAIARSALNLGATGLIVSERRSASADSAAVRSSAGAIQKIQIFEEVNLVRALKDCREAGFWLYGADAEGRASWDLSFNRPLVLVIGAEGEGLRRLVAETVDELVAIPQSQEGVESFNASCAASILLYEIARQAGARGQGPGGRNE